MADDEKGVAKFETLSHTSKLRNERGARLQKYARFKEGQDYERLDVSAMLEMMALAKANIEDMTRTGHGKKYENILEFQAAAQDYFDYLADCVEDKVFLIPDLEGFCVFIGIDRQTLIRWEQSRGESWRIAIQNIKNQIAAVKKQLALTGKIPPMVFAIDFNNNHGYIQQQKVTIEQIPALTDGLEAPGAIAERYLKNVIDIMPEDIQPADSEKPVDGYDF